MKIDKFEAFIGKLKHFENILNEFSDMLAEISVSFI